MTSPPLRLKICHVAGTVEGARWCFEQLRGLRDRHGHDVVAILPSQHGWLPELCRSHGIRVISADLDFSRKKGTGLLPGVVRNVLRLRDILVRENFDVVQTHLFFSMLFGRAAAWLADVPVRVAMIAGPFYLQAHTSRWVDKWTCWMDTMLVPSCELTFQLYRKIGVPPSRLEVIYYGADERRFDPGIVRAAGIREQFGWPVDTPVIVMISHFYARMGHGSWIPPDIKGKGVKGHEDLVRAASIVLKQIPQAKFLLVGDNWGEPGRQYRLEVEGLVAQQGLEKSVIFLGRREDVAELYQDADVAVQAPLNENLGGSIEALLMARPLVATRVGGLVDSVLHGKTGVLVAPQEPQELADGILYLLRDPDQARELGGAGRNRMLEHFSLSVTISRLNALYMRQYEARGPGKSRLKRALRLSIATFVVSAMALRYVLVDHIALLLLPAGWRPWHAPLLRARRLAARIVRGARGK